MYLMAGKHDFKRRGMRPSSDTIKLQPRYPFSGPAFVTEGEIRIFVGCNSSLGVYDGWYLWLLCSSGRTCVGIFWWDINTSQNFVWNLFLLRACSQNCEKWILTSSHLPFCPKGTTRLPLDGSSWHMMFEGFWKICWENSSFFNVCQEERVVYMKTYVLWWHYLAEFFL